MTVKLVERIFFKHKEKVLMKLSSKTLLLILRLSLYFKFFLSMFKPSFNLLLQSLIA